MFKKLIPNKTNTNVPDEESATNPVVKTVDRTPIAEQPERDPDYHQKRLQEMMLNDRPDASPETAASSYQSVHVGPGVVFEGTIGHCAEVIIEGDVEATIVADRLLTRSQGTFNGGTEVSEAEIDGSYHGTLTAQKRLLISNTSSVKSDISYAELEIAAGGVLMGDVNVFIPEKGECQTPA